MTRPGLSRTLSTRHILEILESLELIDIVKILEILESGFVSLETRNKENQA